MLYSRSPGGQIILRAVVSFAVVGHGVSLANKSRWRAKMDEASASDPAAALGLGSTKDRRTSGMQKAS